VKTVIIVYNGKSMKIKKKIIIGSVIVVCVAVVGTIWNIRTKSLESTVKNNNKVSTSKSKMEHSMSSQSIHKKSIQPKGNSQDENKSKTKSNKDAGSQAESQGKSETKSNVKSRYQAKPQVDTVNVSQNQKTSENSSKDLTSKTQTFKGYITSEDDFSAGLKEDTADMVYMRLMALSGFGITFQQDGKWVFYYFDGTISTNNKDGTDGKWVFNGTGSQLTAWKIVEAQVKQNGGKSFVPVQVTGILKGNTQINPGPDADGKKFFIITVESMKRK
jgi:hypothetical protein